MNLSKYPVTDVEVKVLNLRKQGVSFSVIAETIGVRHYQQVQQIYISALNKIRAIKYVTNDDRALLKATELSGYSWQTLIRLYNFLHKHNLLNMYYKLSDEDLDTIKWARPEFRVIISTAKSIHTTENYSL